MADVTAERLFGTGILEPGDWLFHGGQPANNHVSMEHLFEPGNEAVLDDSVRGLAKLATELQAKVLVGIADGGTHLAELVGEEMRLPISRIKKQLQPDGKNGFDFTTSHERQRVERLGNLVIVDDVATRLSSLERVMQIPAIGAKAVGFVAIFCRGLIEDQVNVPLPKKYLVEQYIPAQLSPDSPLWSYAR